MVSLFCTTYISVDHAHHEILRATVQWRIHREFARTPPPPFETKLFHFHGEFSGKKIRNKNYQIQTNRNPFVKLNSLLRHPVSAPEVGKGGINHHKILAKLLTKKNHAYSIFSAL